MRKHYRILLLDADNTLYDFDRSEHEALTAMFASRGYAFTPELTALYESINQPLWQAFDRGEITRAFLGPERFLQFQLAVDGTVRHDPQAMHDDYQLELSRRPYLLPGARRLLRVLFPRYPMYIVTNGLELAQRRITHGPDRHFFREVFVSQTMGTQKPRRDFYDQVFSAIGLTAADLPQVLLIGDNPVSDIKGGQDYGMDTVWFRRNEQPLPPGIAPTYTIHSLAGLQSLLLP